MTDEEVIQFIKDSYMDYLIKNLTAAPEREKGEWRPIYQGDEIIERLKK